MFPIAPGRQEELQQRATAGRQRMRGCRVVIGGCARDLGSWVFATQRRIQHLQSLFADSRVVLYENDSSDETRLHLDAWAKQDNRVSVIGGNLGDPVNPTHRCLRRAQRMATYRNAVRSVIVEQYADFDFALIVDTDLHGGWSVDGLASSFSYSDWDFIGANGRMFRYGEWLHYDAWAFREYGSFRPLPTPQVNSMLLLRGEPLLPVFSCFGGLGIYRMEALKRATYDGTDCEHVALHRKMLHNGFGRLFLNPSQIVAY